MPVITARAIARMAVKDTMAKAASSGGGNSSSSTGAGLLGLAVNITAVLTERADTRSWFTLPGEIHLARLSLPPGEYNVKIELHGPDERVLEAGELQDRAAEGGEEVRIAALDSNQSRGQTMMRFPLFVAVGVFLVGCSSVPSGPPDWVNGKSAKYPDNQYLVGRGQADAQEDARNRARADLAKILEVGISAKSSDVTSFSSGAEGAKTESQVSRSIATRTDQIVRGIQIPETWQDPQTKSTYALAVLPRSQAAMGLRADIDRLDAATRGYVAQARNAPDLLAQVASASKALDSQRERDAVQQTLQVVDVTGRGVEPEQNSGQLAADLAALLSACT